MDNMEHPYWPDGRPIIHTGRFLFELPMIFVRGIRDGVILKSIFWRGTWAMWRASRFFRAAP